jgi:hypothetical protein
VTVARLRRSIRLSAGLFALAVGLVAGAPPATAAGDAPRELWVDQATGNCSDTSSREQVSRVHPWCTLQTAARKVRPGDTVKVMPGLYEGTVQPTTSGSSSDPIRFLAPSGGVTIDAGGGTVGLKVIGVSWLSFQGFAVTGAAAQGVYVDHATGVSLIQLNLSGNGGQGLQVRATRLIVSDSTISANGMAGISELAGSSGNVYDGNTISGNGKDGRTFDGDGIQLNGAAASVRGNTITDNGDPGIFEHGIYAGSSSSDYLIESNTLTGNAASDIKAAGSNGTVRYNRLGDSRLGLVFSDNTRPVSAYYNVIVGKFQHAVFFTSGASAAKARLWDNTIVQTGRLTSSGDASAVFINSAALADIRNDVICYTNRDKLGVALALNHASRTTLVSNTNWLCANDAGRRSLALDGKRTTLGGWRALTGQDRASLSTPLVSFDADFRVSSPNLGSRRGQSLGLERDYVGTAVPAYAADIGAYQAPS